MNNNLITSQKSSKKQIYTYYTETSPYLLTYQNKKGTTSREISEINRVKIVTMPEEETKTKKKYVKGKKVFDIIPHQFTTSNLTSVQNPYSLLPLYKKGNQQTVYRKPSSVSKGKVASHVIKFPYEHEMDVTSRSRSDEKSEYKIVRPGDGGIIIRMLLNTLRSMKKPMNKISMLKKDIIANMTIKKKKRQKKSLLIYIIKIKQMKKKKQMSKKRPMKN